VPGHGNVLARIMLVGEAPGEDEDKSSKPFVGKAGSKLDRLLEVVGLSRLEIWLTNLVMCRPPNNDLRAYAGSTITCPSHWLERELSIIRPACVVTLGAYSGSYFFPGLTSAHEMAGTIRSVGKRDWEMYAIGSYHPAYVFRPGGGRWVEASIISSLKKAKELSYD